MTQTFKSDSTSVKAGARDNWPYTSQDIAPPDVARLNGLTGPSGLGRLQAADYSREAYIRRVGVTTAYQFPSEIVKLNARDIINTLAALREDFEVYKEEKCKFLVEGNLERHGVPEGTDPQEHRDSLSKRYTAGIEKVAARRLEEELQKLPVSERRAIYALSDLGFLRRIADEFEPRVFYNVSESSFNKVTGLKNEHSLTFHTLNKLREERMLEIKA